MEQLIPVLRHRVHTRLNPDIGISTLHLRKRAETSRTAIGVSQRHQRLVCTTISFQRRIEQLSLRVECVSFKHKRPGIQRIRRLCIHLG